MNNLQEYLEKVRATENAFKTACAKQYDKGFWGFYAAIENSDNVPDELLELMNDWNAALADFYQARDGKNGFLGSRVA
jgi:hypothetical protein